MPTKSVSTHSRPKAAASIRLISVLMNSAFQHTAARRRLLGLKSLDGMIDTVSTHSRSKAAAIFNVHITIIHFVSTHSHPKVAAKATEQVKGLGEVSTHSRPKAAAYFVDRGGLSADVSTHSRPKAAAQTLMNSIDIICRFNTQPPEGGC